MLQLSKEKLRKINCFALFFFFDNFNLPNVVFWHFHGNTEYTLTTESSTLTGGESEKMRGEQFNFVSLKWKSKLLDCRVLSKILSIQSISWYESKWSFFRQPPLYVTYDGRTRVRYVMNSRLIWRRRLRFADGIENTYKKEKIYWIHKRIVTAAVKLDLCCFRSNKISSASVVCVNVCVYKQWICL